MNKPSKFTLAFSVSFIILSSCKVTKPYQTPAVQYNDSFRGGATGDTTTMAILRWREVFTDTILQGLIEKGISQNLDLQMAYSRIRQAQSYYKQSRAAFLPAIDANAGASRTRLSKAQGFGVVSNFTEYQLGISAAWEADIWGRLSSTKRASRASLLQTEAGARAIQSEIVSNIASLYYTLLSLDQQLIITRQTVRNWDTTVTTMRSLLEGARVTEAAVVQSLAQRYAAEVTIPDLIQRIQQAENALSILLGMPPADVTRSRLADQSTLPILNTGIPLQLLGNRPDVQEAEQAYRYAFELTNVARTAFYPSLTISGSTGFSNLSLSGFFGASAFGYSITGGLLQPILHQRRNKTNLEVAKEQQRTALLGFQNTLLTAGQEVSDALSLHVAARNKMLVRSNEIDALQKSVDYTQKLLQNGFANYKIGRAHV